MRIANKSGDILKRKLRREISCMIALAALSLATVAHAADAPFMPPAGMMQPSPSTASTPSMPVMSGMPSSSDPSGGGSSGGNVINKNVSALEDKASDSAKGLVKRLDTSSDAMTLEDLNAARQTVARLEAMIDVEKHLAELDKVRSERGVHSAPSTFAGAIPASALAPMPMPLPAAAPIHIETKPVEKEKPKSSLANVEISRITGADGKYSAVLKLANGDLKPVRVGDQVGDHATVRWISASSVLIEENGETHSLHIKNVDAIFSAMR